jgi:protein-S-isoprenylcysteine O-methyltransferase Ste14
VTCALDPNLWIASLTGTKRRADNIGVASKASAIAKTVLFTIFVPGTVGGYIPRLLRDGSHIAVHGFQAWAAGALIVAGAAIYLHTAFWGFAAMGLGTPAPIDPPKILVVRGLHRYVRNPMYVGVGLAIAGQARLFRSVPIAVYLSCYLVVVHLFVLWYEEPTLKRQFGEEYEQYRANVPRW